MDDDLKKVRELHKWNQQVFSFGGMWPLEKKYLKFYAGFVYFIVHVILAFCDFWDVLGDLPLMITNLLETNVHIMVTVKMIVMRHSNLLVGVLDDVLSGSSEKRYKNETERKLYLSYCDIGRIFFTIGRRLALVTCLFDYFQPLEEITKAVFRNETIPFILPYQIRLFTNITEPLTFALVYLSQFPMVYYYHLHTVSVCFFCTIVVHVAGDLSILAHRIRQINWPSPNGEYLHPRIAFRSVVIEHRRIIRTATAIDDIFNIVLMEELVITTVLLGLTFYSTLVKSVVTSMFDFFFIANYCIALLVLILVYCITGDFLIRESINVHDAYYECRWYEMGSEYSKDLTICMSGAQKPLILTAGRFYVFSLARFSDILKTAMAYISMLRTVA